MTSPGRPSKPEVLPLKRRLVITAVSAAVTLAVTFTIALIWAVIV